MRKQPTILCDLDGTLYTSAVTVPGAPEAIAELRRMGCVLRFFTNTDSKPEAQLASELANRGFQIPVSELFTPVSAAVGLLNTIKDVNALPLVSTVLKATFEPYVTPLANTVSHVVVADTRDTLDYALLDSAFRALRGGAELIALQRGKYFKDQMGDHLDTGAIVAALEFASGVQARVIGKPSQDFIRLAAASAGASASEVWVVGDDATTDMAMGNAAGAITVQVETGKYVDQATERLKHASAHQILSIAELPHLIATQMTSGSES